MGIAIILLTVFIKILLYPLSQKSIKSQKQLQEIQPKINDLKEKFKNDKEAMSKAMLGIYKEHKINPLSSCLPLLLQLPFFFAIFQVFRDGLNGDISASLYSFMPKLGEISSTFFGLLDLTQPNAILAFMAAAAQFWASRMMVTRRPEIKSDPSKDEDMAAIMNKQMMYMMPVVTFVIGLSFASGLALYWLVSTLITIAQQFMVFERVKSNKIASS
jgi:YidC/Oxa1 family membrane protein insertase